MEKSSTIYKSALTFHRTPSPGKVGLQITKPMKTKDDLSLAYSPGVAAPCLEIESNPDLVYEYTSKGNQVAVITNGTAVLGLGNIGTFASKPVMEGKACLLKRFAAVDGLDVQIKTSDVAKFIETVALIGDTWGGINLEDIKAPECFVIEEQLANMLEIPVFHDDQHGTAIVCLAGIINALKVVNKSKNDVKIVINGAGSAAIATAMLMCDFGIPKENIIMCDTSGIIYKGRSGNMNQWKEEFATIPTNAKTLNDAVDGADILIGCSAAHAFSKEMIAKLNKNPIIFAMSNPEPEIRPEIINEIRDDAIVGTGRSDYNNQINNVLCFPYLFRGALDCRSKKITKGMKLAAAEAIADVAEKRGSMNSNYIIPSPFDEKLIETVPLAVVKAAEVDNVAQVHLDLDEYKNRLIAIKNDLFINYK